MTAVRLTLFEAGYCHHIERVAVRGGAWRPVVFPARVALLEHPTRGRFLFDTGYTPRFHELTRSFPNRVYAWMTPVTVDERTTAAAVLQSRGIAPDDIDHVVISHFHADHIGGLRDFPRAAFWYERDAYASLKGKTGLDALRAGFLAGLLPDDFERRSRPLSATDRAVHPQGFASFREGYDLAGDGSIFAVPLPGHTIGQWGLFVRAAAGATTRTVLLAADACWRDRSYQDLALPSCATALVHANWRQYVDTLGRIHALHRERPDIIVMPCHGEAPLALEAV